MGFMNAWHQRLPDFIVLARLHKPIGALLLLWPTLWGVMLASKGHPSPLILGIFVAGTLLMRSAGCVINDYADRGFDGSVLRTRERPLPSGRVSGKEALIFAALLLGLAFLLVLPLNLLTVLMAFPALGLAVSYPFSKRFFVLPQAWLGIAFGFGIPMAYAAISNAVPSPAWWLCAANVFWSIAYDTEYAMVDREDDLKIGLHSSAILFGRWDIYAVMVCYFSSLGLLAWVGAGLGLGLFWEGGLVLAGLISLYHYTLIRRRTREGCFKAFMHNNWWGAVIFGGLTLDFVFKG